MIADLHIHYPIHLVSDPDRDPTLDAMVRARGRSRIRDRLRALALNIASRLFNYRSWSSGERVNCRYMHRGGVRVGFSVLYAPLQEFNLDEWYAPPQRDDIEELERQRRDVEGQVEREESEHAEVVHDRGALERVLADGERIALVHCVEGGFFLGGSEEEVDATVGRLAQSGVAYVTLAHLFWRHVAANANALPFLSDREYHWIFHEPRVGLTSYGEAAVRALAAHHVMVDLSHMTEHAIHQALDVLDDADPDAPVLASHAACRQSPHGLDYNLSRNTVERIAARDGVVGLIMGDHIASDSLRSGSRRGRATNDIDDSFDVLRTHVDTLHEWTGSHRHTGIGSDLDGFVKPTLAGIENAEDLGKLEGRLVEHYGSDVAEQICSGNALRLLREYWRPGA